jgi:hypothetical protein
VFLVNGKNSGLWYKIGVPVAGTLMLILAILGWLNTQYLTREVAYRDFLTRQEYTMSHQELSDQVKCLQSDISTIKSSTSRIEGYLERSKEGG